MLATLTDRWFSDPEWIFEPKLDGIRCLTFHTGQGVRMYTRNQLTLDERYPDVLTEGERELRQVLLGLATQASAAVRDTPEWPAIEAMLARLGWQREAV